MKLWSKFAWFILMLSVASFMADRYIPKVMQPVDFFTNSIIGAGLSLFIWIILWLKGKGKKHYKYGKA